jgi:DNA-binding FadR family transcriptional regulator
MAIGTGTPKTYVIVADQLRRQILGGELAEGERLPVEEELTAQFGVARTTLREALRVLESEGLIAIRRGRTGGPFVTHPDLGPISLALAASLQLQGSSVGELDEARRLIEPQIAGQLARQHGSGDVDLSGLETAIEAAHQAAEDDDALTFGLAVAGVHEALVECGGNRTLTTLSKLLQHMVRAYYTRNTDVLNQRLMRRAVRGHRKLVDLIRSGNEAGAVAHWEATMEWTIGANDPDEPVSVFAVE